MIHRNSINRIIEMLTTDGTEGIQQEQQMLVASIKAWRKINKHV